MPTERTFSLNKNFVDESVDDLAVVSVLDTPRGQANKAAASLSMYAQGGQGENVFARGKVSGQFGVACSRCVEEVTISFDDDVSVSFLPKANIPVEDDSDLDLESLADDEDVFGYEGDQIDLEPLIRERIVLAVPFAPLCKEDCKGLCQKCGTNQNSGSCGCETQVIDPRLAALKDFKV